MKEDTNNIRLYEMVLRYKTDNEKSRNEINKYYTFLSAALVSVALLLDSMTSFEIFATKNNIKYVLLIISFIGFILSISWQLTLKSILQDLRSIDLFLVKLEGNMGVTFITDIRRYLGNDGIDTTTQVTKHQMLVPSAFNIIFILIFLYSVIYSIKNFVN